MKSIKLLCYATLSLSMLLKSTNAAIPIRKLLSSNPEVSQMMVYVKNGYNSAPIGIEVASTATVGELITEIQDKISGPGSIDLLCAGTKWTESDHHTQLADMGISSEVIVDIVPGPDYRYKGIQASVYEQRPEQPRKFQTNYGFTAHHVPTNDLVAFMKRLQDIVTQEQPEWPATITIKIDEQEFMTHISYEIDRYPRGAIVNEIGEIKYKAKGASEFKIYPISDDITIDDDMKQELQKFMNIIKEGGLFDKWRPEEKQQ